MCQPVTGCTGEGDTADEGARNIRQVIELYLEAVEDGFIISDRMLAQDLAL